MSPEKSIVLGFAGVLILFLLNTLYQWWDQKGGRLEVHAGTVLERQYREPFSTSTTTSISNGKTTTRIPITTNHPARWMILVETDLGLEWIQVSKNTHDLVPEKSSLEVHYLFGRFSGKHYGIERIQPL